MNSFGQKPRIALTMGDPSGVGPEIIAFAWRQQAVFDVCHPVVLGHPEVLRRAIGATGAICRVEEIHSLDDCRSDPTVMPCLRVTSEEAVETVPGRVDRRGGQAAFEALRTAANLAIAGEVDAIVTGPLHKAALWEAGHHYPGHTEILAEMCGVADFAMMLYLPPGPPLSSSAGLGVVHVTLHMPLQEVFSHLTSDNILTKTILLHDFLRAWISQPHLGVAALNPHAGESGLFGHEEHAIIAPAVERARAAGVAADGPIPADTLMVRARDGEFDGVVAMYHDQGHIAVKLLGMHRAVNVTLGLPIIRTSVAHGTAFDLAWQGRAESSGMVEAVRVAARLALARGTARVP